MTLCLLASVVRGGEPKGEDDDRRDEQQEQPEEVIVLPPPDLEVVTTGTRTPESAQRATVHTTLVTKEEAERRGATNVAEALQGEPNVQVNPSAYGSIGNPSAIQIQGLDRDRVLVLEDGERVIGGVDGAIDLSQLPLSDVQQIEVVTGPTSALYGTAALGGVVNVISAPPWRQGPSGRARVEGRHPWGVLGQATGAYRHDDYWVQVDGSAQYNEGIRLREDIVDLALPERKQYLVGLRAGARWDDVETVIRGRWIRTETRGLTEEEVPGLDPFLIELPNTTDRYILQARETIDLGGGSTILIKGASQWSLTETRKDRVDSPLDETRDRLGDMKSFETIVTIADGPRTWVAGARAEVERYEQELERFEIIGGDTVDTGRQEVAETTLGSGALYAQMSWKLHDVITVLGGARGEMHLRQGGVVAPRLAVNVRPTDWLTVRASGGRGFRVPSARELGFFFDHSILGYRVIGNPELGPERSWGVNGDVSARHRWEDDHGVFTGREFGARAGVYANWVDDLIQIDFLDVGPGGVDDYGYSNIDEARTFGATGDLWGQPVEWLRLETGYAFTWTRNDTAERPLTGRPPHTFFNAARFTLPAGFEIYLRQRTVTSAFIDEDLRSPGFTTLDGRVAWSPWRGGSVYTGVLNALGAQKDPTRLGDQRPLQGRTLYLGFITPLPPELDP